MLAHDPRDSIRAAALAGVPELIARKGGKASQLLRSHGFTPQSIGDPERHVSYGDFIRLLEECATTLECDDFGLQVAKMQDLNVLGPVATIIRHSSTVADGVGAVAQYLSYHTPGAEVALVTSRDEPPGFTVDIVLQGLRNFRQINELSMYLGQRMLELLLGEGYRARSIHFASHAPPTPNMLRRAFGSRLEFDMPINRYVLAEADLVRPVERADPALRQLVARYIERTRQDSSLPLADRVSRSVRIFLPSGRCSLQLVAEHLGCSPRTLQRELARRGQSFRRLQEAQQRKLAIRLLENTVTPLLRVATVTGYSEQSTFNRAFMRWTGKSPGRWRRESLQETG